MSKKRLFNGFAFVGLQDIPSLDVSVPAGVLLKITGPIFQQGYDVTCDKFFTSLDQALRLAESAASLEQCNKTGRKSRKSAKNKKMLNKANVFQCVS